MKKQWLICIGLLLLVNSVLAQSKDPIFCEQLQEKAERALDERRYGDAREYCESALVLCTDTRNIRLLMDDINDGIEQEKLRAEFALQQAEVALADREEALGQIYFYRGRYGLAPRQNEAGQIKYGFIGPELETRIDFQYDEASSFDNFGFAQVLRDDQLFLIDTLGREYPLALNAEQVTAETKAVMLSNRKLTTIPEFVFSIRDLEILYMGNNDIENLPQKLFKLIQLQHLDLSNNRLNILPAKLGDLHGLVSLDLSFNRLRNLPAEINTLKELRLLNASRNKLEILPTSWHELDKLTNLYLQRNRLTTLPSELAELTALRELDLSNNQLTFLPEFFYQLNQLEILDLSNNPNLTNISQVWTLTLLRSLNLAATAIQRLPADSILNLTKLEALDLSSCRIQRLPPTLSGLENLVALSVANAQLTFFPEVIAYLPKLRSLDLSKNQIDSIPLVANRLEELRELSLRSNKLRNFPIAIAQLSHLRRLDISSNAITKLDQNLSALKRLRELDINRNQLEVVTSAVGYLPALEELNLSNNPRLVQFPYPIIRWTGLTALQMRNCGILEIRENLGRLDLLRKLDLSGNPLRVLPASLNNLSKLEELRLNNMQLLHINNDLQSLTELRQLSLRNNPLKLLPSGLGKLPNLIELDLSDCQLEEISSTIGTCKNLRELNLSGNNQLAKLPTALALLAKLRFLNLRHTQVTSKTVADVFRNGNIFCRLTTSPTANSDEFSYLTIKLDTEMTQEDVTSLLSIRTLYSLELSHLELTSFPLSRGQLLELRELDLSYNQLTNNGLPLSLFELPQLYELNLSNNLLDKVPDALDNLPNLQTLYLQDNNISRWELVSTLRDRLREYRNGNTSTLQQERIQTVRKGQLKGE